MVDSVVVVSDKHSVPLQIPEHPITETIQVGVVEDVACPGACTSNCVDINFGKDKLVAIYYICMHATVWFSHHMQQATVATLYIYVYTYVYRLAT